MNILYLKYALEVAKTGSINKAAENLYMAQPNLSRAIKELESSLDIVIFDRTSKGMVPTPDGEKLLHYGKKLLREMDEIENMFKGGHSDRQSFSISVPRACYISYAFSKFSRHIEAGKRADIFYKETNALRAINNILHADYKMGIIRYAAQHDKYFRDMLESKKLYSELVTEFNYVLVMSKNHPLANVEHINFSDLSPYIEIAHADPYVPSLSLSEVRKTELPDNIDRRIFVFERASQFELLADNEETFMWVSPIPDELLARYGLVQKRCEDNKKIYRDVLIYRNDYRLTKLDRLFINELSKAKEKYL
jgi:DNA-binding transcriptional LysR family regulator